MEERAEKTRSRGFGSRGLWLLGIGLSALGIMSRGLLQNRILGLGSGSTQQVLTALEASGGMAAATTALVLEGLESCAVPIFALLLAEGFQNTKSYAKYLLRLVALALLCEVPYNFALTGNLLDPSSRNPVFGAAVALVMLYLYRYLEGADPGKVLLKVLVSGAALLWVVLLQVKFGVMLLMVTAVLWFLRDRHALRYLLGSAAAICCSVGNPLYMFAPFGFLAVHFYNGEPDEGSKALRYGLYPLMLVLIGLAGYLVF